MKKTGVLQAAIQGTLAVGLWAAGLCVVHTARAADAPIQPEVFKAEARGFGAVTTTLRPLGKKCDASLTTFAAEDAEHAKVLGSKRLADLLGFGDLKGVADSGLPGTVLALDGAGFWLLGLDEANFHELFAPSLKALAKLAKEVKADAWQAVPARAYPRWLDGFDNAGPAIWWGGGGAPVDIDSEFPWMKERGIAFNFHPPNEGRYVAPGVLDTTQTDWFSAMAARFDLPFRVHCWEHKPAWLWNREPLPYVRRAPGTLPATFEFAGKSLSAIPYGSEPVSASDPYSHDFRRRFMENLAADPNFLGSKAVAEIPDAGVAVLAGVAGMPETKAYWHSYLVHVLGLDLPKVGLLHHGRRDFYKSWDQVEAPLPRDFLGLDAQSLDLAGDGWEGVADYDIEKYAENAKAGSAPPPKPVPETGWVAVRSDDPMLLTYKGGQHNRIKFADYWLRRGFSVSAEQQGRFRYLHLLRPAGLHGKYCDAFLNGKPLKPAAPDGYGRAGVAFELGDALRVGENRLVLRLEGIPPLGPVVLGPLGPRPYPRMTPPENRRWYDAVNFSAWLRMRGVEQTLQAMRAADPDRPFKMMATINMLDMSTALCERYGAYQHDTGGAGGYWCPMTGGRLARSHGFPWSCEQGGPPANAADFQASMTFYLMYGNDALDMVFSVSAYKDNPDVAAWFDKNLELIKCVGKMHLPTPKIGVLRSTRATRLGFGEPWNWDMARGALQGVGRNFAYVEVPDILNGVIDQFPVVMDCGTVLLDADEIEGLKRYVERGGVFIAQHHTGRHSPEQADAWPLAAALGLKVTPKWMSDENFHRWADAKIEFGKEQELMPSLRGQTIFGSGVAIDWQNKENSGAVAYAVERPTGADIRPVATWSDDGSMAVVEAKLGRGRMILLGSIFFTRMRDDKGIWVNDADRGKLLDEFLANVGVERDSWAPGVWAELWRSKNGVYDLYPVARMIKAGDEKLNAQVSLRRATPVKELVEVSALGHPKVKVDWKDGKLSLPATDYGLMQSRVYIAPRAEIARAGLDWFRAQAKIWRVLPPLPPLAKPSTITTPDDVIPAAEGWRLAEGAAADTAWTAAEFDDAGWKPVKLGSFAALGLPEESANRFRKTIEIPPAWQGRRISLVFNAEWSWGIGPEGRLWIDGTPAAVKQPRNIAGDTSFTVDVTEQAKDGAITLALAVDGSKAPKDKPRGRPAGVTGIFYLETTALAVATTPLDGPWFAAGDVGVLTPVKKGEKVTYTYLETKFTLPKDWPGKRLFLERPDRAPIQHLVLNGQVINVPLHRLDISGLVKKDGENVLRWVPGVYLTPEITRKQTLVIPDLNLVWTE
jgi:hypothetical protein